MAERRLRKQRKLLARRRAHNLEIDMAASGSNGERAPVHELSANAKRDVREMVCGEELPAQWQNLPLRTRQEIQAGRHSIGSSEVRRTTIVRWADEGEKWLNKQFEGKNLSFHTTWDVDKGTITLTVYGPKSLAQKHIPKEFFKETCNAEAFVTETMLAKILMVM